MIRTLTAVAGVIWRALLVGAVALGVSIPALAQSKRWGKDYFPNLPVVTQDGKTLKFYDDVIKDHIVVVSFIYTTCRDICPLVTARLAQLRDKLGSAKDTIRFVSITIDPETDTPELMKAHAEAFGIGSDWLFLTGRPNDIRSILYKLGERSRSLTEHNNEIALGNDRTGSWARDSAFSDLNVLASTVLAMDPARRGTVAEGPRAEPAAVSEASDTLVPGQALFVRACASCHTIGSGDRVGPDLNHVTDRRERTWLSRFMIEPEKVRAEQDPIAKDLVARFKSVRMPTLGLSQNDADDLISYLQFQTYRLETAAAGAQHDHKHDHAQPASSRRQSHSHHHNHTHN